MAKLLLVEDDNNLREIYEARLQAEGYTIVSAKDGEEALVVAKAEKPDLVISDVMMPKISGFEMLDIMRNTEELKGVKVIMLTALGQSDDQQRADKLGADRYLVKSQVTLEDIVKTAHELLGDQPDQGAADTVAPAEPAPATPAPSAPAEPVAPESAAPAPTPAPVVPEPAAPTPEPAPPVPSAPVPAPAPPEPPVAAKPEAEKPAPKDDSDGEARIEDFVAGASSEPTAPTATPAAEPATSPAPDPAPAPTAPPVPPEPAATPAPTSEPQTPAPTPEPTAPSTIDDKLMSDAVDTLVASTGSDSAATPNVQPKKATTIPVTAAPEPKPAADTNTGKSDGPLVHEKVIQPLKDTEPQKDINQLLAEEEAKQAQSSLPPVAPGIVGDDEDKPAGAPMPTPSEAATADKAEPDPGSIAL